MTASPAYRHSSLRALLMLALLALSVNASAQTGKFRITADRDHILPGERIVLTLEAVLPLKGPHVDLPAIPDTFHHLEVLRRAEVKTEEQDGNSVQRQQVTITGFENGTWSVPAFQLTVGKTVLRTDSLHITIDVVKLTDSTYHDIRDIVEAPERPFDWKRWGAIIFTLLLLAALVWNYLRGRKNRPAPKVTAAERASAYARAQQELKALREEDLPNKGAMKNYYTRLYDVLRNYLHRQGGDAALQRTTSDLLPRLKPLLPADRVGPLAEALRIADAVKFAKYPSTAEEADRSWSSVDEAIRTLHQQKPGLDQ